MKLVVGMLVKNEADRYIKQVIKRISTFANEIVILDDNSIDNTLEVINQTSTVPVLATSVYNGNFGEGEIFLRKLLYKLVMVRKPDWFMIIDADEVYEGASRQIFDKLMRQDEVDVWGFRLYDMWDENHYRADKLWRAHEFYIPMLVRSIPQFEPVWKETPQHCGRLPANIWELRTKGFDHIKIKHFGWAKPEDRINKFRHYMKYDPDGKCGNLAQYLSILDPEPNLIEWGNFND